MRQASISSKLKSGTGEEIRDPARFLLDSGVVFHLNRTFFHPMGLRWIVRAGAGNQLEFALADYTSNPILTFDAATFLKGQEKWLAWKKSVGMKAFNLRKQKLRFTIQTKADYKEDQKIA